MYVIMYGCMYVCMLVCLYIQHHVHARVVMYLLVSSVSRSFLFMGGETERERERFLLVSKQRDSEANSWLRKKSQVQGSMRSKLEIAEACKISACSVEFIILKHSLGGPHLTVSLGRWRLCRLRFRAKPVA